MVGRFTRLGTGLAIVVGMARARLSIVDVELDGALAAGRSATRAPRTAGCVNGPSPGPVSGGSEVECTEFRLGHRPVVVKTQPANNKPHSSQRYPAVSYQPPTIPKPLAARWSCSCRKSDHTNGYL